MTDCIEMRQRIRQDLAALIEKAWFFNLFMLLSTGLFGGGAFLISTHIPFPFAAFLLFASCIWLNESVFDTMEARVFLALFNGFFLIVGFLDQNNSRSFQGAGFVFPCLLFGFLASCNILKWISEHDVKRNTPSQK